jgi:hypothetical protein
MAGKRFFFGLVMKGPSEGYLILGPKNIVRDGLKEARKSIGGGSVVKGQCFGESGKLVFATREPYHNWLPLIKKQANSQAGVSIDPEYRLLEAPDSTPDAEDAE